MNRSDGSTADYYVLPEGATQLQDLISHRNMNAQIGEIIRACYRYGMASHSDMLRDAKKIRFYAQAEVERLEKLEAASEQCGQVERKLEGPQSIWSRAPNWAEWVAMDKDGKWYWYENEPRPAHSGWIPTLKLASIVAEVGFEVATMEDDWTRTLSRRPQ